MLVGTRVVAAKALGSSDSEMRGVIRTRSPPVVCIANGSTASATSAIEGKRASGSFASARRMVSSTDAGTSLPRLRRARGRLGEHLRDELEDVAVVGPGPLAGDELVGHDAPRELIAARVDVASLDLLGRHVDGRAGDRAAARDGVELRAGRRVAAIVRRAMPKSRTFTTPSSRIMTFSGFTSRWTRPARCATSSARATSTSQRSFRASGTSVLDASDAERGADHVLHREVEAIARLADVVDADDVGMAERRDGARLAEQPGRELAGEALGVVLGRPLRDDDDLQRDGAFEPRIEGLVDLSHPALAEKAADLVGADEVSRLEHRGVTPRLPGRIPLASANLPWYPLRPFRRFYAFDAENVYGASE